MFLKPRKISTDPRLRSLLQKAARRGFVSVVKRAATRLDAIGDRTWLRSRAVVITCEECWPIADSLAIDRSLSSKLDVLLRVAAAKKQKDAAGLGALAHAYSEGDSSMLNIVPDVRSLKIVSEALTRPKDYFVWAVLQNPSPQGVSIVRNAERYLPVATWQWDKACILASSFLAISGLIPEIIDFSEAQSEAAFPYWVALDKHTDEGKVALRDVAKILGVPYRQLIWCSFYCESAKVNELLPSPWFYAEREWRLGKAGLTWNSACEIWERARPALQYRLELATTELRGLIESSLPSSDAELQHSLI